MTNGSEPSDAARRDWAADRAPHRGGADGSSPPPALEIRDLWVSLRGRTVLEGVNLTLAEHEFLGVIGPNGGGKTTLLRAVLGLIPPDRGTVRVFGRSPAEARGLVGYVPQHVQFDAGFPISVLDVVLTGRLARRASGTDSSSPLRRLAALLRPFDRDDRAAAYAALEKVQMSELAGRQIGRLSGGELQRTLIARALALEPRLLLLDEPAASLDTPIGQKIYDLLEHLTGKATVVLVSHDIGVISQRVRTVACLNRRLHYHGTREIDRQTLEAAYGTAVDLVLHGHSHRALEGHPGAAAPPAEPKEPD